MIAVVQTKTATGTTNAVSVTLDSSPTQNNLIVVVFAINNNGTGFSGPSGYTAGPANGTGGGSANRCWMWYKVAGASESSTISFTGLSANWNIIVKEFSGCATSSPLTESSSTSYSATSSPTASVTQNTGSDRAGRLIVGGLSVPNATDTITPNTYHSLLDSTVKQTNSNSAAMECYVTAEGNVSKSATFTLNNNRSGGVVIAAFKGKITDPGRVYIEGNTSTDTYIDENNSGTNYGTSTTLIVGPSGGKGSTRRRIICKFDLSSIPTGSKIVSAKLYMYVSARTGSPVLQAARLTQDNWIYFSATWLKYDGSNNWTTAGGDYDNATHVDLGTISATGLYTFSGLETLAQYAIDNIGTDILSLLISDDGAAGTVSATVESDAATHRMMLEVTYGLGINKSESITVSDVKLKLYPTPLVLRPTEALTVADVVASISKIGASALSLSALESLSVSDVVSKLYVNPLYFNVYEGLTAADVVYYLYLNRLVIRANDSVAAADAVSKLYVNPLYFSVNEALSAQDVLLKLYINPLKPLGYENLTVQDALRNLYVNPLRVSKAESLTVSDAVSKLYPTPLRMSPFEGVSVQDVISKLYVNPLRVTSFDSVAALDALVKATVNPLVIRANEQQTVADQVLKLYVDRLLVRPSESVTVSDTVTKLYPTPLSVQSVESLTVLDVVQKLYLTPLVIRLTELLSVTDTTTKVYPTPLNVRVQELLALSESLQISMASLGTIQISVAELVTLNESIRAVVTPLLLQAAETITVTDALVKLFINPLLMYLHEDTTVADVVRKVYIDPLNATASEQVVVQDVMSRIFLNPLLLNAFEGITVGDLAALLGDAEFQDLLASESITVADVVSAIVVRTIQVVSKVGEFRDLALALNLQDNVVEGNYYDRSLSFQQ